ncbi:unnamed protein product [Laminaria digitata]
MDGSSARLNGKGEGADFACLTFIDDSPPLQTWGCDNVIFAEAVRRGKGGDAIFLEPWWLFGPRHEVTTNKRLWDMGAELVENIPHSLEAANSSMLSEKTRERLLALERNIAITPQHPVALEDFKRQRADLEYAGPLTGHEGGVTALSFNRESGKIVSAGANGEVVQWQAFFFLPPPPLSRSTTPSTSGDKHPHRKRDKLAPKPKRRLITPTKRRGPVWPPIAPRSRPCRTFFVGRSPGSRSRRG